jgi:hypothetical protein
MTKAQWIAQIPAAEDLTIDEALRVGKLVLADARGLVDSIFYSHHGTVPPPPWPAPPSMVMARKEVEKITDGIAVFASKGVHRFKPDFTAKLRERLIETGSRLWDETDTLQAKWEKAQHTTDLIRTGIRFATGHQEAPFGGLPTLALAGVGLYVIWRLERGTRRPRQKLLASLGF